MKWLLGLAALGIAVVVGGFGGFGGGGTSGGVATLTADQLTFCSTLAADLGADQRAICAWVVAEGNVGNPGQPTGNMLFISCGDPEETGCVTLNGRAWATFDNAAAGAQAAYDNLTANPKWYGAILADASGDPLTLLGDIGASPWDAGHYADPSGVPGSKLATDYAELVGIP